MLKIISVGLSIVLIFILFACTDTLSDIDNENDMIYQIPGCQNNILTKSATNDSCFSYSFNQNLIAEFNVMSNCCPDSDRFEIIDKISNDTLYVIVIDTSEQLCDCICNYKIHFEKYNLSLDSYLFYCNYNDEILYSVRVFRRQNYY